MRSKLFVPGSRPELFAKALAGAADALSFDLEDSVTESRKAEARQAIAAGLRAAETHATGKTLIVRVNPLGGAHFEADIAASALPGVHLLNLPKVEGARDVLAAVAVIEHAERANGVSQPIKLLLNIESPLALQRATELALSHPRVAGLQLGLGDLFEPLGVARRSVGAVQQAMFAVRMAAGAAGIYALDGAFADIADAEGYRAEAAMARDFGFAGKTCIHPSQVALANAAFQPTTVEIAHALRVVDAAAKATRDGTGAYVVDGKMIDAPFVIRAEAIVSAARRLNLIPQ